MTEPAIRILLTSGHPGPLADAFDRAGAPARFLSNGSAFDVKLIDGPAGVRLLTPTNGAGRTIEKDADGRWLARLPEAAMLEAERHEREFLRGISRTLSATLTLRQVGLAVAEACRRQFAYDAFSLTLLDESEEIAIGVYAEDTAEGDDAPAEVVMAPQPREAVAVRPSWSGRPVLLNRGETIDDTLVPFGHVQRRSRSLVFAAIRWEGHQVGVLSVQSYTPERYGRRDLSLLESVADYASGLLARLRTEELLRATQQRERVITTRLLRETEARFRAIIELAVDPIFIKDLDGRYVLANPAAAALFGMSAEQLAGKTDLDLFGPEDGAEIQAMDREIVAAGRARRVERKRRFGAVERVLQTDKIPFRSPEGRIIGIIGISRDLTERHKFEQRLRDLFDHSPDAVFIEDLAGTVLDVNPQGCRLHGMTREQLVGKSVLDLVPPDRRDEVRRAFVQFAAGTRTSAEGLSLAADGTQTPVELRVAHIEYDGSPALLLHVRDVSDRRRLEEQVLHTQKLESLGVLAGGIAHDFNNLLMSVLGHASLARGATSEASPAHHNLKQIETAARRAAELTNQLLAYSGKGKFTVQPINLSALVQEMASMLAVSISKKAELRMAIEPTLPMIEGDPGQIRQIVMNLITNASDAVGDGTGTISIGTGHAAVDADYLRGCLTQEELPDGEYVWLEVIDTGCGMDETARRRLFDPFFTTKFKGRGLGMAAVAGIVRGHRGAIRLTSAPGRGSSFRVLFPASDKTAVPDTPRAVRLKAPTGGATVLVVDDEEGVREVAQIILQQAGFTVMTAVDGADGVETFKKYRKKIHAVLMDMTMPRMSGAEAFREIRRLQPDVSVVISSGFTEEDAIDGFGDQSPSGFIQKPYLPQALVAKVNEAIRPRAR